MRSIVGDAERPARPGQRREGRRLEFSRCSGRGTAGRMEELSMKILVAGGAGYIGSTVASAAVDAGHEPVILDNLVTGRREFCAGRAFYEGDIADGPLI